VLFPREAPAQKQKNQQKTAGLKLSENFADFAREMGHFRRFYRVEKSDRKGINLRLTKKFFPAFFPF
jgi:hypothetical protein